MTPTTASPLHRRAPLALRAVIAVVVLMAVTLALGGCGSSTTSSSAAGTTTASQSTTTGTTMDATTTGAASTTTQTGLTPEQKAYTEEMKATANAARELSKKLEAEGLKESDPRAALLLGLHARTQAVSARKFINDADLANADVAFREMRTLLARASIYATDTTAAGVKAAQARLDAVAAPPSQDADTAAAALDDVIKDLAPLVETANKETGADTTATTGLVLPATTGTTGSAGTTGTT